MGITKISAPIVGQTNYNQNFEDLFKAVEELQEEVFGDRELMERKPAVKAAWEKYQFVKNLSKDHT